MGDYGDLHYPNLSQCRVTLVGSAASSKPPVRLPNEILQALHPPPRPEPYDFSLERKVIKEKEVRERDLMLRKATSREELQQASLAKMKRVTGAKDEICIALLESNGYDLKTSIEAFYLR